MQKNNNDNYITILKSSLVKKIEVLNKISEQNEIQKKLINSENFDYNVFEKTLEEKEKLVGEINKLDFGFQSVYDRVKEVLETGKDAYADEIKEMQRMISEITDKSMDIMAEENRNKDAIIKRKDSTKKEITMARTTNKVAANYYKTMSKLNVLDSQFIDTKK